jgi:hypothetical protein
MMGCTLMLLTGRVDAVLPPLLLLLLLLLVMVVVFPLLVVMFSLLPDRVSVLLAGILVALLLPLLLLLPPGLAVTRHPCDAPSPTPGAAFAAAAAATAASAAACFRPPARCLTVPAAEAWLLHSKVWPLLVSGVLLAGDALLLSCRYFTCRLAFLLPGLPCCRGLAGCCCCCSGCCCCCCCGGGGGGGCTCMLAVTAAMAPLSAVTAAAAAAAAVALTAAMSKRNKRVRALKNTNDALSTTRNLPPMQHMLRGASVQSTEEYSVTKSAINVLLVVLALP